MRKGQRARDFEIDGSLGEDEEKIALGKDEANDSGEDPKE